MCNFGLYRHMITAMCVRLTCMYRARDVSYILHEISDLKRFASNSFRTKLTTKIKCPVYGLNLERFAAEKCKYI